MARPWAQPEGAKGFEAPTLAKSKLRKKDKILNSLIFCVSVSELRVIWPNYGLKIDHDTVKHQ